MSSGNRLRRLFLGTVVPLSFVCFPSLAHGDPSFSTAPGGATAPFGATVGSPANSPENPVSSGVSKVDGNTDAEKVANALLDPNYKKCGQDCMYQRANETISLQIDYILKKREFLKNPKYDDEDKERILGGFCGNVPVNSGSASVSKPDPSTAAASSSHPVTLPDPNAPTKKEKTSDCIDRYMKITGLWLLKARGALGKNEGMMAQLGCAKWDNMGRCIEAVSAPHIGFEGDLQKAENQKKSQVPYFIKATEIAALQEQEKLKYQKLDSKFDNKTWFEEMKKEFKPDPADFVKFRKILRDPANPASGYFEIPAKKTDGTLDYDEAAYKRALKAWEQSMPSYLLPTITGKEIKESMKQNNENAIKTFKDPNKTSTDPSRLIFNEVQGEAVHFTTEMAKPTNGWGKKEANFPGKSNPDGSKTLEASKSSTPPGVVGASGTTGVTGASGAKEPEKRTITLQRPEGGYSGNESVVMPPEQGVTHQYYFRYTGSQVGVHPDEKAGHEAPSVRVKDPKVPDPNDPNTKAQPPKRTPSGNDGTYSDTQSVIDLYF